MLQTTAYQAIKRWHKFYPVPSISLLSLVHLLSQSVAQYNPFHYYGKTARGLFLKDKSFSHQSECRVVVNTADTSIINMLVGNPIEIGSLKEIAVKADDYLDQGAIVKATATIYDVNE